MSEAAAGDFHVDGWVHAVGGFVCRHRSWWIRLGNLETRLLADEIARTEIRAPIYVAGLARSGTTVLLEILDAHPHTTAHRYSDYPLLYIPYLWNRFLQRVPQRRTAPVERSHGDRIMITPESPEAFEEVLWMSFFPNLHDPRTSEVLDGNTRHPQFEQFYRDHVRKLLAVRGAERYVSKGNYNVTRLEYLLALFPDARFVIPVRDPVWHVASLMKQHRLFCARTRDNPKARTHLRRVGHFEFGPDRRPINAGDTECVQAICAHFAAGRDIEGWALYWNHLYGYLADRLEQDERLRESALVVHYEALCSDPRGILRQVLEHCRLAEVPEHIERAAARVRFPDYYQPPFTRHERTLIERLTAATAARLAARPKQSGVSQIL